MDPDRWQEIQELFDRALLQPEAEREAFLEREGAGDQDLLREVHSLLTADRDGENFFEDTLREGLDLFQSTGKLPAEPTQFGKYEILEEVGEGGFGKVYRGRDPQLERAVAIKTCNAGDPGLRQRFFREARIAAGLQHPKIVTVHDFGEEAGLPFLVQELLGGEDLDRLIERGETLPLATKLDVLLQIAQGLAYAHQEGVLHRDIKPANIRVLADDQIKIMDFGIACLLSEEQRLTLEHTTVGTIGYIAPEQLTGKPLDERSDIFSFGVLAYELLTLERPFKGRAFADISHQILHQDPTPIRRANGGIPKALADYIHRCLARAPEARPANFQQVTDRLLAISEVDSTRLASNRHGRRLTVVATATAVATLLVFAAFWPNKDSLPSASSQPVIPLETRAPSPAAAAEKRQSPSGSTDIQPRPITEPVPPVAAEASSSPPPPSPEPPTQATLEEQAPPLSLASVDPDESTAATLADAPPPTHPTPESVPAETELAASTPANEPTATEPSATSLSMPELIQHPEPRYPVLAQRRRQEAQITLAVLVDSQGRVQRALVTQSNDPGLGFDEAARETALEASFRPALRDGEPTSEWAEMIINFRLP